MSSTVTDALVVSTVNGLCGHMTINRHAARNALNVDVCRQLRSHLTDLIGRKVRTVVITGAGTAFSSGADLDVGPEADHLYPEILATLAAIQNAPAVVIAAVNGPAIGAGTLLAMACDLRVVSTEAWFMIPAVDVAIALDGVSVRHLERLVGGARARAMLLTAARLSADESVDCGFALQHGTLDDAHALAADVARKAPLTVAHLKAEFTHDGWQPYPEADRARLAAVAQRSQDTAEARQARAEMRPPVFRGE